MKVDPVKIVVVEDDPAILRGLCDALTFAGHQVSAHADGESGLAAAMTHGVDLMLLDLVLPGLDGLEVLKQVRSRRPTLPVVILTAKGSEGDRIRGLKDGADDYVVKPYSVREVLARVEAVMRRTRPRSGSNPELMIAGRRLDLDRREVALADGERRQLSEKETEILSYLVECRGRAVGREELLRTVWRLDPRGVTTRTVDMHVARLREKLGCASGGGEEVIVTVRGAGYMLAATP